MSVVFKITQREEKSDQSSHWLWRRVDQEGCGLWSRVTPPGNWRTESRPNKGLLNVGRPHGIRLAFGEQPQSWTPRLFDWFPRKLSFSKYAGRTEVQKWPLKKRRWIICRVLENDANCHFLNTCIGTTHVPSFIFTKYFHGLVISHPIFAFSFSVRQARKCGPYFPSHRTEAWKELRIAKAIWVILKLNLLAVRHTVS